ncbi:hypothetical protein H0I31_04365 [Tenacibaculum sp. AHE15PA]|uniref:hypothetical protein n=1 Tax=unclassified Tenacibaculum TaxID=2635139 RepID=UPI001C4F499D|nr:MULTISPECIES: hypothetical protein [unclassified Tenacibaculum]QXP72939.1 hypothetical protein H0I30_09625 [Tenacibaculum sp. AHE14PA]QXP76853.1 hypothetical protein H0I31_04365 [Tenacibaculum sp. AHE15PA]
MHKKLASDLTSLAHSILRMKNKDDVFELKQKAHEVYEKLSVLAYIEEYINNTHNPLKTKEELLSDILLAEEKKSKESNAEDSFKTTNKVIHQLEEEAEEKITEVEVVAEVTSEPVAEIVEVVEVTEIESVKEVVEITKVEAVEEVTVEIEEEIISLEEVKEIVEQPFDEIENLLFTEEEIVEDDEEEIKDVKKGTLEDELEGTISVDVMADLFEKVDLRKSLNDQLQNTIQIDLNDRIVFVKHLFDGNQSDFNRVVSQLNTFKTEKEAKKFINKMIKPDYDWSNKEEYEARLFSIIERRFV